MTKELELLEKLRQYWKNNVPLSVSQGLKMVSTFESALKTQQRKLDLISEVLVDASKGNYADLNDAINDIREVLEDE